MTPIPLHPNLPTPTTAFGNPAPIAQYYICPHCKEQSPLVREWVDLTDEDKNDCLVEADPCECLATPEAQELMRCVAAKLRSKNT